MFADLQTADAVQARAIEEQIWLIWFRHPDRVSEGLLDEGTVLMGQRRWNEALDRFDQLVARAPDFAEAWNKRATTYFLLGDLERSVLDIQRTLALEPRHFGALSGLGQIYLQLDEPKAALRAFEAALSIHPGMPGVQRQVVDLRARIGGSDI
ncbi:MAG TPA: tetratricopeptide repeat protein [Geminicoccus sp.]|uniref:tetratricopeptide repeat protein n=1 Tax=Geminicoccus sp. TaxID=2024832 RepID=UPI002E33688A|nr:tetratricopeptide repeat protein [Geminicoccus sp.]HEX2526239.1 tetratricopeptide repeat protein [Geminicoccus sp.]